MREQEVRDLYEAYKQVHQPQEEVEVVDEAREANRDPEGYEERQRTSQSSRQRRMNDPNTGINSPAFHAFMAQQMGGKKKKKVDEETDLFDTILEYLVAEGYADTNEAALKIMANMSEEWRQSIVDEAYNPKGQDKLIKKMSSLAKPDPDSTQAQNQKRKDRSNKMYDKHYTSYVRPKSMPSGIGGPESKSRKNKEKNG